MLPQTQIQDIPEAVMAFLYGPDVGDGYDFVIQQSGLPKNSDVKLAMIVDTIIHQSSKLPDIPTFVSDVFRVDEKKSKQVAIDLAGRVLLPISAAIGDVAAQIRAWGGDPEKYKDVPKVSVPEFTIEGFIKTTVDASGLAPADPMLRHRLELALVSYVNTVRNRLETKQLLTRAAKVGGLAWSEADAENILLAIDAKKDFVKIGPELPPPQPPPPAVGEATVAAPAPKSEQPKQLTAKQVSPLPANALPPPPTPPRAGGEGAGRGEGGGKSDTFTDEDAVEIQKIQSITKTITEGVRKPSTEATGALAKILAESGVTFANEELKKRFERAIDARIRDIRDAFETRAQLESSVEHGGLGIIGKPLSDLVGVIERVVALERQDGSVREQKGKEEMLQKKRDTEQVRTQQKQKQETEQLAKRYVEITGKQPPALVTEEMRKAVAASAQPKPVVPMVSTPTITQTPGERPKVDDIRFERRLAGPVEELRTLSLVDFRRLSRDPKEASLKIKDKAGLLEQQGPEQKIAAVKAWRESPLNQAYLSLSRESLMTGKNLKALLEEKRALGAEILTADELDAIMALNAELRF